MKVIIITVLILVLMLIISITSYKQGVKDSVAILMFSYAGNNYAQQKILREQGDEALLKFLDHDINSTIAIHKGLLESQSILSDYFGPTHEIRTNRLHYIEWYESIMNDNSFNENKELRINLKWLIDYAEK